MSITTKKKWVEQEVLYHFPVPKSHQYIAKILKTRGNNLHEAVLPNGEETLVSMPPKFRNHIYVKKGSYVIADPITEGNKVTAEITAILFKDQIKHIKNEGLWPSSFSEDVIDEKAQSSYVSEDMLPPTSSSDSSGSEEEAES